MDSLAVNSTLAGFYLLPFVVLLFSGWLNRQFKLLNLSIKVVDLIIPYLLLLIYIISQLYLPVNLIPYIVIALSLLGVILASYYTFYKKHLNIYLFFRLWWRYVFLIVMTTYCMIGFWLIYRMLV